MINKKVLKSVNQDANSHYKAALEKRKDADKKENEKRLARKRKQKMIKEIEGKKR